MNIFTRIFSASMLLIVSACASAQQPMAQADSPPEMLASVITAVSIEGSAEAVFDLVTTARFWPQWHPATQKVGGVTERPYTLGDRIEERGRIGEREFRVIWRVAEHARPLRVVLRAEGSNARISYSFSARGRTTEFSRELKYSVEELKTVASDPGEVNRLMRAQSEQAVNQLKKLIEKILGEEAASAK